LVRLTVDVKQAGTYRLSSTWACAGPSIDMKISFASSTSNGYVLKNETKLPQTAPDPAGYHAWVPYTDYATVQLEAGVQVMQFQSVYEHMNFDYVEFALVATDGGAGGAAGAGGSTQVDAGAAGAMDAGGASGAGGGSGAGGAEPAGGDTSGCACGLARRTSGHGAWMPLALAAFLISRQRS
jgi:hypothetical protein